jgi:signal transduction histidine kinase/ligand-binding sensor domain-containing protein/DNA-binding response OmpR family regulator
MNPLKFTTVLLICLVATLSSHSQSKKYQFGRINMNNGLSHHNINGIIQDSVGFLWFATASGLNRYDGYSMKVFRNVPGDTNSLATDEIIKIFRGPEEKLWLMTHTGNMAFNPKTENFIRNTDQLLRKYSIADGVITYLKKDKFGRFWFVHYNQGIFCYDPSNAKTTHLTSDENNSSSISTQQISSLAEDKNGNIWVAHQNGTIEKVDHNSFNVIYRNESIKDPYGSELSDYRLFIDLDDDIWIYNRRNFGCFYFDISSNKMARFTTSSKELKLNSNIVSYIIQGNDSLIWIGTENGGINLVNKKDFSIRYLMNDEADVKSLVENTVQSIYKDQHGIIWIGSQKGGVSYYHQNIFRFEVYKHEIGRPETLPFNDINALEEDRLGNIWIGTNGGGLIYFDRKKNTFKQYLNKAGDPNSISNNYVISLLLDHEDALWVGTYYGGLNRLKGNKNTRYLNDPLNPKSIGENNIWDIYEDADNNLWIGTLRGGLDVFHRDKNEFLHYRNGDINSIHTNYVPVVTQDSMGNMWVGTGYGLEVMQKSTGRFTQYLNTLDSPGRISSYYIQSIYEDSRGWMWVGTIGGLSRFNAATNDFTSFYEQDGLAHNSILSITEDGDHNLWMSTPKGISKLSISITEEGEKYSFKNYYESDGLIQGVFHENVMQKCSTGEIIFGGSGGFNIFNPADIKTDLSAPPILLTDFQISNQSIGVGEAINGKVILPSSISQLEKIVLSPDHSFFSIEFAALNFFHPEKSQYKYLLEGFNDTWISTPADQRRVTFTNLDPGTYTFRVRGTNSDGLWNENEAVLYITILPPFWKSNLALVIYAVLILAALLLGRRLIVARERLKFSIQTERNSAQRIHELDLMKIKFFTNVSHELRTPLTLIITPLERLLKNARTHEDKKQYQLIHRNARRLLNLVNQLLDFKRMESEEFNLNLSEGDIVQFTRDLVWSFSDLSEKKNIHLSFNAGIARQETFFDTDKIEKIIFNLLSNAFKFTPENGQVIVDLNVITESKGKWLIIKVKDTGIGIPADKKQKIFERFFQNDLPGNIVNQGSGIGLSITQEFIKLHGGSIEVESELGKGSTFFVKIPVVDILSELNLQPVEWDLESDELEATQEKQPTGDTKPSLLLVEDNEDFRSYLKDNLKAQYTIIDAANGRQGLEKALSFIPELIVSDIMMPEMDGVELCKRVKEDSRTSHIPVILLTARTAPEQEVEGFQSGANDYITKPFSFEILESRIHNLLNLRSLGHKQFQKHLDIKVSEIEVASVDEKLIQDAVQLVEDNLVNKDFSVEEMSHMLAMSRVHLYKKLHSLTGKTPIEFIRFIRIQRAAQLLTKSNLTVSEIAYQVGFNHPKYFTKYFREVYKMLPSQFMAANRTANQK